MYKIEIINEVNGRSFGAKFADKDEKNAWIDSCIAKQSWGKNERQIPEEQMTEELRSRIINTEVIPANEELGEPERTIHTVKPDYVITETNLNLSKTYRNQKKIEARKAEYPSIEEVMHIILDHGIDSPEFSELQSLRQSIKDKYPKE